MNINWGGQSELSSSMTFHSRDESFDYPFHNWRENNIATEYN